MMEIIQEYWESLLWSDGYHFTGVAVTLWLLILSVLVGGFLACFLLSPEYRTINSLNPRFGYLLMSFVVHHCMFSCLYFIPEYTLSKS